MVIRIAISLVLIYVAVLDSIAGHIFYQGAQRITNKDSLALMEQAAYYAPWEVDSLYFYGDRAFQDKQYELCIAVMKQVNNLNGSYLLSDFLIAASMYELGMYHSALSYCYKALELYPYHLGVQQLLGRCYYLKGLEK